MNDHITVRDWCGVLLAVFSIAVFSWFVNTYPWFGWVVAGSVLGFVVVGGIWALRREVEVPRAPAPRRSLDLPSDGPGHARRVDRHRPTRTRSSTRRGPSISRTGPWL